MQHTYDSAREAAEELLRNAWNDATTAARAEGLTEGHAAGYAAGHEVGYAEGYAAGRADCPTPDPDPEQPAPERVQLGIYRGNPHERPLEVHLEATGVLPDFASLYVQAWGRPGGTINVQAVDDYLSRGVGALITVTLTGGTITHRNIVDRTPAAMQQLDHVIDALNALGSPDVWVKITLDHEHDVKSNPRHPAYSWSPTAEDYIGAFNVWHAEIKRRVTRPNVQFVYWYGYARRDYIAQILAGIDRPDAIMLDPYVFSHHDPGTTFEQMATPQLEWLRSQPAYDGQPIWFAEYAKDLTHGEDAVAEFLTDLRPTLARLGVAGACYFSRTKDGDIDADIFDARNPRPKALAAYTASLKG
ncbi:hypothetical protein [Serinicoccus sediminis]|uniref:hypothetical protein n=1 Tax=Serinicoccus sediminis TaxID=2306021 RepID=UPI00102227CE|nr:hypothetical protein [Serinicoccus sediminis]